MIAPDAKERALVRVLVHAYQLLRTTGDVGDTMAALAEALHAYERAHGLPNAPTAHAAPDAPVAVAAPTISRVAPVAAPRPLKRHGCGFCGETGHNRARCRRFRSPETLRESQSARGCG